MPRDLSAATTFKDKVRPASAVSRWSMDNSDLESGIIKDSWGSNDGSLNGGVSTGVSGVGAGEAFGFEGSEDIEFGDTLDFVSNTNSSTITAWIKTSSASRNPIIAKQSSGAEYADGWSFGNLDSGEIRFSLRDAGTGDHDIVESTATVNDGKWHLVTIVKGSTDISDWKVFVDGVENTTVVKNESPPTFETNHTTYIAYKEYNSDYFNGELDEVRVYSEALSQQQIWKLYNIGRNANWGFSRS